MAEPEHPDFAAYAQQLQKTMADALAQVDAAKEEALKARDAALEELAAAREDRRRIEQETEAIAEQHLERLRKKMEDQIRQETLAAVVKRLLAAGRAAEEVQEWLDVPVSTIKNAQMALGFKKLGPHDARLEYETEGRSGTIIFHRGTTTLRFWWEFGGGDAVVLISVPDEEQWEAQTGLPLSERLPILDFVGTQAIQDKAPGCYYMLNGGWLEIIKR